MDSVARATYRISRVGAWFGGALLFGTVALIGSEVVLRKVLNVSISGIDELCGYAMAIGLAWSLPFALLERSHIRIDVLYSKLSTRVASLLDLVSLALFVWFFGLITWYAWEVVTFSHDLGSRDATAFRIPLVIPQSLWFAGFGFLLFTAAQLWIRGLLAILGDDLPGARRLVGSRTLEEEVQAEVAGISSPQP